MADQSRKRKRTALDIEHKQEIIAYHDNDPTASQQQIADHFSTLWSMEVKRRTVSDILSQRDKWMTLGQSQPWAKRFKLARHAHLERFLSLWISYQLSLNVHLSDEHIRAKARHYGEQLGIADFNYSNGWLHRFKQRHGICKTKKHRTISGEEVMKKKRPKAKPVVSKGDTSDSREGQTSFNCDTPQGKDDQEKAKEELQDAYINLSPEKTLQYAIILAEINRKFLGQNFNPS